VLQQRMELARLGVEQADLNDVELKQVLGVMQNVLFEKLFTLGDRHVVDVFGAEAGELSSGCLNRCQLSAAARFPAKHRGR